MLLSAPVLNLVSIFVERMSMHFHVTSHITAAPPAAAIERVVGWTLVGFLALGCGKTELKERGELWIIKAMLSRPDFEYARRSLSVKTVYRWRGLLKQESPVLLSAVTVTFRNADTHGLLLVSSSHLYQLSTSSPGERQSFPRVSLLFCHLSVHHCLKLRSSHSNQNSDYLIKHLAQKVRKWCFVYDFSASGQ